MSIGTDAINKMANEIACEKLGVSSFSHEREISFNERPTGRFQRQFFKFTKDGNDYSFCIDPITKIDPCGALGDKARIVYDWEAMQQEVEILIMNV